MSEQVGKEFESEDIEFVKDLQSQYATNTAQLGQVEVELYILNKRLKQMEELRISLFQKYDELQINEEQLVQKLNEKYGDGVLDLDSGRFIPSGL
jgi:predicted nuclease with TOPRIM domain